MSAPTPLLAEQVPFVPWDQFTVLMQWQQGEHVALIGPTGTGKTTMALALLPLRQYVCTLATKPRDETLDHFGKAHGYRTLKDWRNLSPTKYPRRIIWPPFRTINKAAIAHQREVFFRAMDEMYAQGGWCVYIDEGWWFSQMLNMGQEIKVVLQQGRSLELSLLFNSQRPAWIPVEVYDQSTHLFFWLDQDERNLDRIGGIGWKSSDAIKTVVSQLRPHEVLYVNTRTGALMRTQAPPQQPAKKVRG